MEKKNKDEYLAELKLVLERVRAAVKVSSGTGSDCEEFLSEFLASTVGYNS